MVDLAALPTPRVIEELDFEAVLDALMADIVARLQAAGVDYDVGMLETDTLKIQAEVDSYRETLLRARNNDVARANLLAFAQGGDLDHLGAFYGVTRLAGEEDGPLRQRIVLAIQGRSTAGPAERYESVARGADARVREARAYVADGGPLVRLAILSREDGGVPGEDLIETVSEAVNGAGVRVISDVVEVVAAVQSVVDVSVRVWLLPDAPAQIAGRLEEILRQAWMRESGIGFDLNPSWIAGRLHVSGVARVEILSPSAPVVVDDNHAVALGSVAVDVAGRLR